MPREGTKARTLVDRASRPRRFRKRTGLGKLMPMNRPAKARKNECATSSDGKGKSKYDDKSVK